jgi:FAD/FMN-containing dehydrogenase
MSNNVIIDDLSDNELINKIGADDYKEKTQLILIANIRDSERKNREAKKEYGNGICVKGTLLNVSGFHFLSLTNKKVRSGKNWESSICISPSNNISPLQASTFFHTKTDRTATGSKAGFTYQILTKDGVIKGYISVAWENPFIGKFITRVRISRRVDQLEKCFDELSKSDSREIDSDDAVKGLGYQMEKYFTILYIQDTTISLFIKIDTDELVRNFFDRKRPSISEAHTDFTWENWSRTESVGGNVGTLFKPHNCQNKELCIVDKDTNTSFVHGLSEILEIVQQAEKNDMKLRAHGSKWSLNNIAYNKEYLIDSSQLKYCLVGLSDDAHVTNNYKAKRDRLSFVQCGVMVKDLNEKLQKKNLALSTSGASDGQTLVGAVSTGTHGSAHEVGAMQDYVKGIHLVTGPGKHVFIQREGDHEVITKDFCDWLGGAELINDDEMFYSALVGFGSFGIVHALLIEVEPLYLLKRVVKNLNFSEVKNAICTLDMSGLGLPGDELPFHFEITLNPWYQKDSDKGAFVRTYYKHTYDQVLKNTYLTKDKCDPSGEVAEWLFTHIPDFIESSAIPFFLQGKLEKEYLKPAQDDNKYMRFPGAFFSSDCSDAPTSLDKVSGTSFEISVPFSHIEDALNLILNETEAHVFGAALAFRYVKSSSATLAFTGNFENNTNEKFSDIVVTIEMPGGQNSLSKEAHKAIFKAFDNSDIPHRYHWGQDFPINNKWVIKSYGKAKVNLWMRKRSELLGEKGCKMFSNKLVESIALSEYRQ